MYAWHSNLPTGDGTPLNLRHEYLQAAKYMR